ncbi:MAG: peptidase M48 [Rhodobacteraceae bacterium MED-G07]|jgi:putative metalloprotease|nr:MAG: peptidase M48 [Rhodobacteraceae bacterium MED-G07]|tara:strand:- start:326 stop:967 length:642 start_codon:yes stop_codon:yes gene_type:complete
MFRLSAWQLNRTLKRQSSLLADRQLLRPIQLLANALDLESISVSIYEIEPVNGLAAPDGRIFITRGFYDKFTAGEVTENELASVIAHELGHVALGHSKRRMIDFSGQNALRMALGTLLSRILPGIGGILANLLSNLLMARLSRSDEFEADEYASALMMKSGIGVEHQISMFEKLEQLSGNNANLQPAWLLSHPKTMQRIKKIQENETKWSANQ